jgi:hypothetical protein
VSSTISSSIDPLSFEWGLSGAKDEIGRTASAFSLGTQAKGIRIIQETR